ncbi:S1C family serine protease [Ramlibacter humi]|uniref:Serine protease n=1 Tax=Ramlibacter humi TaxID=2530451 RepID=A0A4Z0BYT0_9BURK|nr:S1C family serine protease [Ramlibacter humi]TFZ03842.1 serine protease [Ramlibacter humi]
MATPAAPILSWSRAWALLFAWCAACAWGATGGSQQASVEALTRAHAAVVGISVNATEGARSADTLGRERSGSGVVIGPDGLVLTIGYLMLEAENIQVVTQDQRTLPARAVAYDLATGFGLVRTLLPLRGITPVTLGSIADLQPGDALMAATGGEDSDVLLTQVVGKRPFSGYWEYHIDSALFTSPPIANHSGAPVFNQRGELVGIGSLIVADATGLGRPLPGNMFVPVDLLKPILPELLKSGSSRQSRRPWLGLTSSERGGQVQIVRVNRDSPAEAAGLQPGDVVLSVDGVRVASLEEFYKKLWDRAAPDTEVRLTVLQGADTRTLTIKPVDRMSTMAKPAGI